MDSGQRAAETKERVLPYPFWVGLAACATPDVQSQLLQTTRAGRSAVVQSAQSVTLTTHLSSPSAPDMLGLLRTSCRTLPARVRIVNDNQHFTQREANHMGRMLIPRLACAAITRLSLRGRPEGKGWLVDAGLLQDIHDSLPGLRVLNLMGTISTPRHPHAYRAPSPRVPALTTIQVSITCDQQPDMIAALLLALGVRADGSVAHLSLYRAPLPDALAARDRLDRHVGAVIGPMLRDNHLHALRKLSLPNTTLNPWAEGVVHGLIHNTPALEHLQVGEFASWCNGSTSVCVPWRILDVLALDINDWRGLPLGTRPGQPPLIVRVMNWVDCHGPREEVVPAVEHLTSTAAGHRELRLECARRVFEQTLRTSIHFDSLFRVLSLARFGLSNLFLDGIDTEDGIKHWVEMTSLTITLRYVRGFPGLQARQVQVGLSALPQVTSLEVKAEPCEWMTAAQLWADVDAELLSLLPPHITDVHLCDKPTAELVAQMCVAVSRVPHRQVCPLRLCVPGVPDWFSAVSGALLAANIDKAGIVGVP